MPQNGRHRLTRLREESPTLLGLAAALMLLWTQGRAFVLMDLPGGFDWERYHRESWQFFHGSESGGTWLEPLYPLLLSSLGESLGYGTAGLLISSVALVLLICGAALIGRALAGPWAGGVAALAIPMTAVIAESARWVNLYPLLAAVTALSLGAAAAYARWPRWSWATLAGLAGGLAWAMDPRGVAVLPSLCVLLLLGLPRAIHPRRRVGAVLLFAAALAAFPLANAHLRANPRVEATRIALDRRGLEITNLIRRSQDVRAACQGEVPEVVNPAALFRPCASAFQDYNRAQIERVLPFGVVLTVLCLPLVLLRSRKGWRQTLMAAAVFAPPVLMVWVMARWITASPRYTLQMAGPLAAIVPVALMSLTSTLLPKAAARWGASIIGIALGAWIITTGPAGREDAVPLEESATYTMVSPIIVHIRDELGPDDVFLDCSESHIEAAVLPRMLHSLPVNPEGHDWARCNSWITQPKPIPGDRWLVTGQRSQLTQAPAGQLPPPWVLVMHTEGMNQHLDLWRWDGK